MRAMAARLDESMPVGNEGGGIVVAAGASPEAQALLGKTVGALGGAMYSQYRTVRAQDCMAVPEGATPRDAASCFVNPLTALAMVETMKMEGHTALVHTAAASNLGQMLNKICLKDGVQLVNIVRSPEQAKILADIGATQIVDSTVPSFMEDLIKGADRHGRDAGVRRHRRRQAGRSDPHRHGGRRQRQRQGLQPLWLNGAQAGLYLWRARPWPDGVQPGRSVSLGASAGFC